MDTEQYLERLLQGYVSNYDIFREEKAGDLKARAELHMSESQCAVFKEVKMWTADSDEYSYFFCTEHLTKELAEKYIQSAYDNGFPKIDLDHRTFKNQHMCTVLSAIVICQTADEEAVKTIKKCSIYKNFAFSLKGWMEMHSCVVELKKGSVTHNRYGRETGKYLEDILSRMKKGN